MTYCVRCEFYVKCQRRVDQNKIPFHCNLYRRPGKYTPRGYLNFFQRLKFEESSPLRIMAI